VGALPASLSLFQGREVPVRHAFSGRAYRDPLRGTEILIGVFLGLLHRNITTIMPSE